MPIIPALQKMKQKGHKFKHSLDNLGRPGSKKKKKCKAEDVVQRKSSVQAPVPKQTNKKVVTKDSKHFF